MIEGHEYYFGIGGGFHRRCRLNIVLAIGGLERPRINGSAKFNPGRPGFFD